MKKYIAVEIDDVLNNFSEMLNRQGIRYDSKIHTIADPLLKKCLYDMDTGLLTEIAQKAMGTAFVRRDGAEFLHSLHDGGWTIVLYTSRDLRFARNITAQWLREANLPYDYLFQVDDLKKFCADLSIPVILCSKQLRLNGAAVFTPAASNAQDARGAGTIYHSLLEVQQWIQKNYY